MTPNLSHEPPHPYLTDIGTAIGFKDHITQRIDVPNVVGSRESVPIQGQMVRHLNSDPLDPLFRMDRLGPALTVETTKCRR